MRRDEDGRQLKQQITEWQERGENPRWPPDFPADRHYRSSPSPDRTQLPFTRESRGCRGRRAPAARSAAGASRLSGGPRKDRGRDGKHRRAPHEDASAALALDPRSCSSRLSAIPAVSWQH
ncbi:hypothetical protein NDU88_005375 [Pleurodeles waltl]|uniref:Uncharacterized protein n=1 Tax=Pleurodeles waltl TaxID=8319 RepID=A0AAV7QEK2_PLEWA|nr:hypothetical protein NDU88_005375 [Pleurodeles waltl]